ncbi:trans-sulfuration enzyme family protein [Aestuariivirga sp.]|uniref:trans-sulfuration enzyme family protein n=1 Tax=Aestuariivirga sp. TaxID=2650926 RepID=UPI0039E4A34D
MSNEKLRAETIAAHALRAIEPATGAVVPPLYLASTYARNESYEKRMPDDYQRAGNPTLYQAEALVAALEEGAACLLYPSGMAAIAGVVESVPMGGHVIAPVNMYYGVRVWLKSLADKGRIALSLIDMTDTDALRAAMRPGKTDLVWIETPSNPMWDVIDIAATAAIAHESGAILGVDATATAAVTTRPLTLGADIVFHSVTKYLNGHSDVLAGALITREANERWAQIQTARTRTGAPLAPFECWLLMRGLRTLFVRFREASANAKAIARHFSSHPKVERVLYPGLATHPGYEIARRQMTDGFGGMMSFLLRSDFEGAKRFCTLMKVVTPATSLGGPESLAEHRKLIEGPDSPVPDNLVRFSIGIENVNDLIADLSQALDRL